MEQGMERERNEEVVFLDEMQPVRELGKRAAYLDGFKLAEMGNERPLAHIEDGLNREVIGQPAAIESLVTALYREKMRDPKRPLVTLMFLGPTGVGKSESAKVLNQLLHGNDDMLVKINCSEIQQDHRVSALIGAAPEYTGRTQKPLLDKKKIERHRSVVLFDEIEKGAPALHDLLLQILDDGEVTLLNTGEKVSFKNSIVILTSNVGAKEMQGVLNPHGLGFREARTEQVTRKELEDVASKALKNSKFRPELINRIDEKIVFSKLDDEQIGQILDLNVEKANKAYREQGLNIMLTPELRDELVKSTPDRHEYGARPVLSKYRKLVEGMASKMYASGGIRKNSQIYAVLDEDEPNDAPLQDKIKLYHRRDKSFFGEQAGGSSGSMKALEQKKEQKVESPAAAHNRKVYTAAAIGVAAVFLGDYLSSRRGYGRYA